MQPATTTLADWTPQAAIAHVAAWNKANPSKPVAKLPKPSFQEEADLRAAIKALSPSKTHICTLLGCVAPSRRSSPKPVLSLWFATNEPQDVRLVLGMFPFCRGEELPHAGDFQLRMDGVPVSVIERKTWADALSSRNTAFGDRLKLQNVMRQVTLPGVHATYILEKSRVVATTAAPNPRLSVLQTEHALRFRHNVDVANTGSVWGTVLFLLHMLGSFLRGPSRLPNAAPITKPPTLYEERCDAKASIPKPKLFGKRAAEVLLCDQLSRIPKIGSPKAQAVSAHFGTMHALIEALHAAEDPVQVLADIECKARTKKGYQRLGEAAAFQIAKFYDRRGRCELPTKKKTPRNKRTTASSKAKRTATPVKTKHTTTSSKAKTAATPAKTKTNSKRTVRRKANRTPKTSQRANPKNPKRARPVGGKTSTKRTPSATRKRKQEQVTRSTKRAHVEEVVPMAVCSF